MSIDVNIAANSIGEFEALESEGAPSANMGASTFVKVMDCFGIDTRAEMNEHYCGTLDPEVILAASAQAVLAAVNAEPVHVLGSDMPVNTTLPRVAHIIEMAQAASRLGRNITWG